MPFKIVRNDIAKMQTEAIVNTASDVAMVGTGCDTAVYKAAGYDELLAYRREKIGFVPEGEVFLTPGFKLQAKYIIHAVSPFYVNGTEGEEQKLRSCYRKSLRLAKEHGVHSIAFPLISTGGFGYPKEEGMRIAVDEINAFLLKNDMEVYLVVFSDNDTRLGEKIYPNLEEYIDRHYVQNRWEEEYGDDLFRPAEMAEYAAEVEEIATEAAAEAMEYAAEDEEIAAVPEDYAARDKGMVPGTVGAPPSDGTSPDALPGSDIGFECPEENECHVSPEDFEKIFESVLKGRVEHVSDTFSEYLMYLIRKKKMKNADVYKRAIVDKKIFSKIKNNVNYHPQKLTALCLCIGAKLNLDEATDLLARAGYALSPCDKTDIIFSFFIENEIYDMIELDIQLEEHGLPCIIS